MQIRVEPNIWMLKAQPCTIRLHPELGCMGMPLGIPQPATSQPDPEPI